MSITPADLLAPVGEIEPSFFPSDDDATLEARLQAYIDDGEAQAANAAVPDEGTDQAVEAWAYYRAYKAIWLRLSEAPSSLSFTDQGSRSRTDQQREAFHQLWQNYLAIYNGLTPAPAPQQATTRAPGGVAMNRYVW
ncbi:MAG TPA: hypothetical protein VH539_12190 [Gemmatimonadaceae bacterium]|jgi:hypothetical protein